MAVNIQQRHLPGKTCGLYRNLVARQSGIGSDGNPPGIFVRRSLESLPGNVDRFGAGVQQSDG